MFLRRLLNLGNRQSRPAAAKSIFRPRLRLESLEDRRLLTAAPLFYSSSGGALTLDVSADHLSYEVRNNSGTVVAQQLVANTSNIEIIGSNSSSNSLTLNLANSVIQPTAVSYSGQTAGEGAIQVTGPGLNLPIAFTQFHSATDFIIDELNVANRSFSFSDDTADSQSISLAAGSSAGSMDLESNNSVSVAFANPTSSLSISETGLLADTISLSSVDANYAGTLTVIGGNETVNVAPATIKGNLTINAGGGASSKINIDPSTLSVTGNATFLAQSIVVNSTSITTTGNQTFGGAVNLNTTPVTLMSGTSSTVMFDNTVDGNSNLTVNVGTATFAGAVGSLAQLRSLTVNAGTIQLQSTVNTSGAQTFTDPSPASLAGSVYVDANDNGTFDTGETPLAGVTITLVGTNDLHTAVSLTTTTAANGSYSFSNLRPGTYTLTEAQPANYLIGTGTVGSQGGIRGSGVVDGIVLTGGTSGTHNDFAELVPGSLSGYVYSDANNNGVFDSGELPIAGATITLSGTNDQGNAVHVSTTTAVNGAYSFGTLRPGTYTLTETRPTGYIDGADSVGSQGGTVGVSSFSSVVVTSGTNGVNNDFANLVPASLSGSVIVAAGSTSSGTISGVTVSLTGTNDLGAAVSLTTTTASDGTYSFNNLVPGTYTLTETRPSGYLAGTDVIGSQGGTVGSGVLSNINLTLGVSGTGNNFVELRASSLSGFAYVDANGDGQFNSGETPLAGVTIMLSGTDDLGAAVNLAVGTGSDGSYGFSNLRPGTYTLTETQPAGYTIGTDAIGNQASGTLGSGTIMAIALLSGTSGANNNFASVLVPPAAGTVDLSGAYNLVGITPGGVKFTGGLDGVGNALSANLLGTSQVWNGVNFSIGAAAQLNEPIAVTAGQSPPTPVYQNNVIQATGQTIDLPAGQYAKLEFLATATNGNQLNQTFIVHYSDGTSTTVTQNISDWYTPQHYAGESVAVQNASRNTSAGGTDKRTFDVYGYTITLDSSKTVSSITLPNDKHVDLLAISTVNALAAPSGLTLQNVIATDGGSSGAIGIALSWTAPAGAITGYNIYRGTAAGGESTTPINSTPLSPTTTGFVDANVLPGNTYFYVVRALSGPASSAGSNEASIATNSGAETQVDLTGAFNVSGITADGAKFSGGLDGQGNALSSTLLGSSQTWNDVTFAIGAAGGNNVVQSTGQTIALPSGQYQQLDLLATGVNSNQLNQKFTVNYTDGTSATVTQNISDWNMPQSYAGQSVAVSMAYRNMYGGGADHRTFDVYGYVITLDSSKTVSSITLPNDKNVGVLAISAVGTVAAPTGLTASAAAPGEIDLNWSAPSGAVSGYNVYRGTASGGESTTPINSAPLSATATSYQDTSVVPGNTYYYVIRAINSPAISPLSSEVSATTITSGATTQVDLSGAFNLQGITAGGATFKGGLDGVGNALSSTLVGGQSWAGGTTSSTISTTSPNVIQATGQTIALPVGQYSKVDLLATATNGNQAGQAFIIHYSDGTSTTLTQSMSDWFTPQNYAGESTAITSAFRNTSSGGADNRAFYVYSYTLNVDSSKTVTSITLPSNKHVDVLAISTVQ